MKQDSPVLLLITLLLLRFLKKNSRSALEKPLLAGELIKTELDSKNLENEKGFYRGCLSRFLLRYKQLLNI